MMERLDQELDRQDRQEAIDECAAKCEELAQVWGADNFAEWWDCNGHFDRLDWKQTADVIERKIALVKDQQRYQDRRKDE